MAESRAFLTLKATGQIAAIYADIVRRTRDYAVADAIFKKIEAEIDRLVQNPGIGMPKERESLKMWVHVFDTIIIEYRPTTASEFEIEVIAVLRKPGAGS